MSTDIRLTASESNWRLFSVRKADPAFLTFWRKILVRDHFQCHYCGFKAKQFQQVVNANGNYLDNRRSNLVTTCCFCAQCLFLESVGIGELGGGSIIYLPQMKQTQLNAWCHTAFAAIAGATQAGVKAKSIYRSLKLRSQLVEKQMGEGMSNPVFLGRLLIDAQLGEKTYKQEDIVRDLRLLPSLAKFSNQARVWLDAAIQGFAGS